VGRSQLRVNPENMSISVLFGSFRSPLIAAALGLLLLGGLAGYAHAQEPDPDPFAAEGAKPAVDPLKDLHLNSFSPVLEHDTALANAKTVHLEARLTEKGEPMTYGLSWRVFQPIAGADGKLPLLASSEGGSTNFELVPGEYFVHVAFGRAGATKKLIVSDIAAPEPQTFVLDAGGMVLNAVSGADMAIPADELTFNVYTNEVKEDGERPLIMGDVKPGEVVRLNAGTYHVVSNYGNVNATIRADIQIQAGKLTEATIQHKAAKITLKLVSQEGGEAIADTAWSILTGSGDAVSESVGAFPVVILAEGKYTAVARHKDKIYQRDFSVTPGRNQDIEVLLQD
jgi:hypothetical protein